MATTQNTLTSALTNGTSHINSSIGIGCIAGTYASYSGIPGTGGVNGSPSPVVISNGIISTHGSPNPSGTTGSFQFTPGGDIMVHDGTTWVTLCGLGEMTQIDKIKEVLREYWPEVLFDLMMRDLI